MGNGEGSAVVQAELLREPVDVELAMVVFSAASVHAGSSSQVAISGGFVIRAAPQGSGHYETVCELFVFGFHRSGFHPGVQNIFS